mmetsp:Transcript_112288/g.358422  ORF Transcript_112288/g.358422 Transcript_112288/m.358422 type:complete len:214 (-) Transcript_112288:68-709(-)
MAVGQMEGSDLRAQVLRVDEILEGRLYLSSLWAARSLATLRGLAITHVLCVAEDVLGPLLRALALEDDITIHGFDGEVRDAIGGALGSCGGCADVAVADFEDRDFDDDECGPPLAEELFRHLDFIDAALEAPNGRCLVHCRLGLNRSAAVVIAWLMTRCDLSFEEAEFHLRQRRPAVCVHPAFERELCALIERGSLKRALRYRVPTCACCFSL